MPKLDFSQLQAALQEDANVNSSAATLIQQLLADVEAAKNDPVELQSIVDQYRAQTASLAAAVAAGTPGSGGGETPPPGDGGGETPPPSELGRRR